MIEYALLTAAISIADEMNTSKRAKNPSPEQIQMRTRWAKNQQIQNNLKSKLAEFDKSLADEGKE